MISTEISGAQKRHFVYQCKCKDKPSITVRKMKNGCGKWITLSTSRTTGTRDKPWFGVCPYCGKKSRMRHREKFEMPTRAEARAEAFRRNLKEERREEE